MMNTIIQSNQVLAPFHFRGEHKAPNKCEWLEISCKRALSAHHTFKELISATREDFTRTQRKGLHKLASVEDKHF